MGESNGDGVNGHAPEEMEEVVQINIPKNRPYIVFVFGGLNSAAFDAMPSPQLCVGQIDAVTGYTQALSAELHRQQFAARARQSQSLVVPIR